MSKRTITLTNRPPVCIDEDKWPLIASAKDSEHDGQVECQANRKSVWFLGVRRHADGRAIVYAKYSYDTNWQHERSLSAARGELLAASDSDLVLAIRSVGAEIAGAEHAGDDASRWDTLVADCIADLPAEELV